MDTEIFIQNYDELLEGTAKAIENMADEVVETYNKRPSALAAYAELGKVAALIYSSIAMAEKYRDEKMWLASDDRKEKDEWNYGMMLHYINSHSIENASPLIMAHLHMLFPNDHCIAELAEHEGTLISKILEITDEHYMDRLSDSLVELAQVLKDIFCLQHPEHTEKDKVTGRIPYNSGPQPVFTEIEYLVLGQAYSSSAWQEIVPTFSRHFGTWPYIAVHLIRLVGSTEEAFRLLRDGVEVDRDTLEDAADRLKDMDESLAVFDRLIDEYHAIATTPQDENFDSVIANSTFPLVAHAEAAIRTTSPFNFLFPRMAQTYKDMCREFKMLINDKLAGKDNG